MLRGGGSPTVPTLLLTLLTTSVLAALVLAPVLMAVGLLVAKPPTPTTASGKDHLVAFDALRAVFCVGTVIHSILWRLETPCAPPS